jgi:G3E family GTPase
MIPVSVITGFLGSGKTTLLRRLLADRGMADTVVLVNEFGEVGLDHLLLRKVDEDIVLLNSGCLCCTVRDDLVETLDELQSERGSGSIPMFNRVVIETTGLADPAPIVHTLMIDPALTPHYRLLGLVATIDATHGGGQMDRHPEAVKQAATADRLVLTKTDLLSGAATALEARLTALNPGARLFRATLSSGPGPQELFDAGFSVAEKRQEVQQWLREESYSARNQYHHDAVERHDSRIGSFCLTIDEPIEWELFVEWLKLLLASRGDQILRLKGLLNIAGRPLPVIIHGVQHVFYPPTEHATWPDGDRSSKIVFITSDLPRPGVETSLRETLARQRPRTNH